MAEKHVGPAKIMHACHIEGCGKQFNRPHRLDIHLRTHTGERPFKCSAAGCDRSYVRKAHLDRHIENAHIVESIPKPGSFRCKEMGCFSEFTLEHNLKKHIKQHHSKEALETYKCDHEGCGKSFRKKHQLRQHSFLHKGIVDPLLCTHPGCMRSFSTLQHLRRHLKMHEGYSCDKEGCSFTAQTWSELRAHKGKDHVEAHTCSVCGKTFPKNHKLAVHFQIHHQEKTTLPCPHEGCKGLYWDHRNLSKHIRHKHTEGGFKCTEEGCEEVRASKQRMRDHIRLAHSALPPQVKKGKKVAKKNKCGRKKRGIIETLTGLKNNIALPDPVLDFNPVALEDNGQAHNDLELKHVRSFPTAICPPNFKGSVPNTSIAVVSASKPQPAAPASNRQGEDQPQNPGEGQGSLVHYSASAASVDCSSVSCTYVHSMECQSSNGAVDTTGNLEQQGHFEGQQTGAQGCAEGQQIHITPLQPVDLVSVGNGHEKMETDTNESLKLQDIDIIMEKPGQGHEEGIMIGTLTFGQSRVENLHELKQTAGVEFTSVSL